jgi:hypothetical protein
VDRDQIGADEGQRLVACSGAVLAKQQVALVDTVDRTVVITISNVVTEDEQDIRRCLLSGGPANNGGAIRHEPIVSTSRICRNRPSHLIIVSLPGAADGTAVARSNYPFKGPKPACEQAPQAPALLGNRGMLD